MKMRHMIFLKSLNIIKIAEVFIQNVFKLHKLSDTIISDHRDQFIVIFWKMLCTQLRIEVWLSTAFHSETDNQTENVNTIMKQYLQMYCSYLQDDWEKWLSLVKFITNNIMNESMSVISFYATYEQNSQIEFESQTEINEHDLIIKWLQQIDVNNFADQMNKLTDLLWSEMLYAQALQEYHVNKEWMLMYDFKPEDKIYLSTWNLKMQQLMKKLDWKFTEWLTIRQKMSLYVYEFKLSSEMKVHSMFHISLLWLSKNNLISR